jgi:hypothetical protein
MLSLVACISAGSEREREREREYVFNQRSIVAKIKPIPVSITTRKSAYHKSQAHNTTKFQVM